MKNAIPKQDLISFGAKEKQCLAYTKEMQAMKGFLDQCKEDFTPKKQRNILGSIKKVEKNNIVSIAKNRVAVSKPKKIVQPLAEEGSDRDQEKENIQPIVLVQDSLPVMSPQTGTEARLEEPPRKKLKGNFSLKPRKVNHDDLNTEIWKGTQCDLLYG
jgi:hypothetical protein